MINDRIFHTRMILCVSLVFFAGLMSSLSADRVKTKEGEVYEGRIVERSDDELVLRTEDGDEHEFDRSDVAFFVLDRTKFTLKNKDTITGRVLDEMESQIEVETEHSGVLTIQRDEITKREEAPVKFAGSPPGKSLPMEPTTPWSGSVDLGYTVLRGNSREDSFFARARVQYKKKPLKNESEARFHYATSEGEKTEDRGELKNKFQWDLNETLYLYQIGTLGYDRIRELDHFVDVGAGGGMHLLQDIPPELNVEVGPHFRYEKREDADNESEYFARVAEEFKTNLDDRIQLIQKVEYFQSLSESGEYRSEASVELDIQLEKNLSLKILGEQVYDSDPPPGVEEEDLRLVTTLGYNF